LLELGTQTAALAVGGFIPSPPGGTANVEQYNGSSWTEIADLNASHILGTQLQVQHIQQVITFGGAKSPSSTVMAINQYYNGSSWSEEADLNTARYYGAGTGTAYTAALATGGSTI
jgi:hypothetical protein